jgi:uncharacterized LabA/DUF88 family protein
VNLLHKQDQRVGVFIDTQNLYHSAKNLYQAKVNFGRVVERAINGRSLVKAIAYVISTESGDEQGFFEALEKIGIENKTKPLQIFAGGSKKADWDVGLAIDAVKLSSKLDVIVIASGDGDFVPLVEYLKINAGCRVEVIAFGKASSGKLIEAVDEYIDMSQDARNYLIERMGSMRRNASTQNQSSAQTVKKTPRGRSHTPGKRISGRNTKLHNTNSTASQQSGGDDRAERLRMLMSQDKE